MTETAPILYFTRFDPSVERGGGSRRLLQLLDMLPARGVEVVAAPRRDWLGEDEGREQPVPGATDVLFRILATGGEHLMWSPARRNNVWRLRRTAAIWRRALAGKRGCRLALVDDPVYFRSLAAALLAAAVPVVAVCHNIESLVPSNTRPFFRTYLYGREKLLLRRCRFALTIAEEETRILSKGGVETVYVPSYPPEAIERDLREVRAKRAAGSGEGMLLLGSAVNEETREGMKEVIAFWRTHGAERLGGRLLVAGFGTDRYFSGLPRDGSVSFLGPLSATKLQALLSSVRGAVCYQREGGGALTRIAEFLVAGVPVIANGHAARSYGSLNGLLRFENLEGLADAVARIETAGAVEAPRRPTAPPELQALIRGTGVEP